jgi:hypothetical protein
VNLTSLGEQKDYNQIGQTWTVIKEAYKGMSDLNRGIMKFEGADSPKIVTISTVVVLGSIALLILWALQSAYAIG